jgi:hypothetical protein
MTWTNFWTVIGIVYPLYYLILISYDLYKLRDTKNGETSPVYDVSGLFDHGIKPTVVEFIPIDVSPSSFSRATSKQEGENIVEGQRLSVNEFLIEARKDSANISSSIFD